MFEFSWAEMSSNKRQANVEVTGAARLYRAASVWTAGLGCWIEVKSRRWQDGDNRVPPLFCADLN